MLCPSAEYVGLNKHLCKIRESGLLLCNSYDKKDRIDLFIGEDNYCTLVRPGFERMGN